MRSDVRHDREQDGTTIPEMMVALIVLVSILLGTLTFVESTTDANKMTRTMVKLDRLAQHALTRVSSELISTSPDQLQGSVTAAGSSSVTYRPAARAVAGMIVWGNLRIIETQPDPRDPQDGIDNDNDGLTDELELVLRTNVGEPDEATTLLIAGVSGLLEGEIANNLDDNGNGIVDEGGVLFTLSGSNLVIRMTVLVYSKESDEVLTHSVETSVTFRN